jgi:zinc transport system substrate-binding protein
MRYIGIAILAASLLTGMPHTAHADIKVVASIKPVHSLISGVMDGAGTPYLLMDGAGSPHSYALKPSQAAILQQADIVFWVGKQFEAFLAHSIDSIATRAISVPLIHTGDLNILPLRDSRTFDTHTHGGHGHDDHDDHDKEDHDKDSHEKDGHDGHGHGHDTDHDENEHAMHDQHIWLDPINAQLLVHEIADHLARIDSEHADIYKANAASMADRLDALVIEIDAELAAVTSRPYIVFHDAYQYFEHRFGVSAIGSITVSPEIMPGADRIRALQQKIARLEAICLFSEPQFEPKLVATIAENTDAKTAVLDPLGTSLDKGPALYFTLIRNMAASLTACLAGHS